MINSHNKNSNSVTNNSLLILQFNANGLKNHAHELELLLNNKRIDIALITETHFTKYSNIFIPGYKLVHTNHPDNTAHGGVAIYIKSIISFQLLPSFSHDFLQSCAINIKLNNNHFTIAAVYAPPKHNITFSKFSEYFITIKSNFIIGGDYNAKHQAWGCRTNNPRGVTLHNFINTKKLKIFAPPGPTYWPSSPQKNPDILDIFVTRIPNHILCHASNLLDLNSDHSAVLFTLNASPSLHQAPLYLFNRFTDIDKFQESIDENIKLNIKLKTPDDIDSAVNNLTKIIQTAAWSATNTNLPPPKYNPIPEQLRVIIVEKRRARALYQRTRLPSHKQNYNRLANSLKKQIAKHKDTVLTHNLSNLSPKDGSLWKATKKVLRYKASNLPLKKSDGSLTTTDLEKAELFKLHLSEIFQPHLDIVDLENTNVVNTALDAPLQPSPLVKSFSPNDVKYLIHKYPRNKSPGFDLITSEVANNLPKRAIVHLTHIYNSILRLSYFPLLWKFSNIIMIQKPNKPPDSTSSYRPISLLPFFAKILERLLLKRIVPIIAEKQILPDYQFGFRTSHSTIHQVHRLVDAISYSLEKKLYCTCAFLDISQAFDRVWHQGLLYKLKSFLPTSYFLLFKSYLSDRSFKICYGTATSEIASINAGVPQGGILSPLLYNIFVSDQPTSPNTSVADYADDKVIISINDDPSLASAYLQTHLGMMERWYTKWKFKVNQNKSVHTTFTLRQAPCPRVLLYGIPIPSSPSVKYLGLTLDQRLTWAQHIREKRLSLSNRLRMLKNLIANKSTPINIKLLMYKTLLKPIWTYGLQLWGNAKKSNLNKIQAFQNMTLRKLFNAPPYISNHTLHLDCNLNTIHDEAKRFYKKFHNCLSSHSNPLIKNLSSLTIPGSPPRRLKRKWCRDLLL